jgi:hypothetical protein
MFIYVLNLLSIVSLVPVRTYTIDVLHKIIPNILYFPPRHVYLLMQILCQVP